MGSVPVAADIIEAELIAPPRLDRAEKAITKVVGVPFVPGQSGNPRGRPPKRLHLASVLADKLDAPFPADVPIAVKEGREPRTYLETFCDAALKAAMKAANDGDLRAWQIVVETAFGKAPKELVHTGQVDHTGTVTHEHTHHAEELYGQFRGRLEWLRNRQKQLTAGETPEKT